MIRRWLRRLFMKPMSQAEIELDAVLAASIALPAAQEDHMALYAQGFAAGIRWREKKP